MLLQDPLIRSKKYLKEYIFYFAKSKSLLKRLFKINSSLIISIFSEMIMILRCFWIKKKILKYFLFASNVWKRDFNEKWLPLIVNSLDNTMINIWL